MIRIEIILAEHIKPESFNPEYEIMSYSLIGGGHLREIFPIISWIAWPSKIHQL